MEFTTKVTIPPLRTRFSYETSGVALGSCFASEMAARMQRVRLGVCANPFGVLYNPASIAAAVRDLARGRKFREEELYHDGELWHSFAHHGSFSHHSPVEALEAMNGAAAVGGEAMKNADWVILTLGTAWVYEREGRVVANCHKLPATRFTRRRMSVEEVVDTLGGEICEHLNGKSIILTVSPVRHIKDGLAENARSKAILIEAAHRITDNNASAEYFPAFEIVTDELRDYRFYAQDMVHPSAQAADHVWRRLCEAACDARTRELMDRVEQITAAAAHRPLHPGTPSYAKFRASMAASARELRAGHPEIDIDAEIEYFSR